jgi:anaerobic dimethyl sulfoxide reductase subunit A
MINGADSPTPSSDAANVILGSKLIVMVGYRPSGTFKNAVPYAFTLAKKKGIPIICIDPVYTPDAEVFADQWIPIIPGTDTAFFTAVANYIIHNNLYNQTFINTYTYGFQQWANYVTGVTAGPDGVALDRTPAWAAPICGIPAATIIAFAQLYAKSNPTYLKWHYGSWRKSMGEEAPRTQMSLQAIMGYIGVLGGNTGNWESCEPSPASISVSLGAAATYHTPLMFRQHQWAKMINLVPKVKAGTLSASDYKRTIGWQEVDVGTGATNYPLPTPMMAMGSAGQMTGATNSMFEGATALQSLQYFVYATYFMHPSAYYADILLPRIDPALEGYSVCGTQGSGQNSLMGEWWYSNKAVPAPGQCKPDEWYCTQIANALSLTNYNQYYTDGIDADPNLADWDTMMVSRLQASYTTFAATMAKNVGNGPNAPAMIVPTWQQFVAGANIKLSDWNTVPWVGLQPSTFPIKTSTGKINILIDFFNTTSYPAADGQAVIDALPSYGRNYPAVPGYIQQVRGWYDSLTTKYPLVLLSTHSRYRDHSAFFNNPMLRPEVYQHHVWISATDAIARGISDGDNVTVVNDKGTIVLPAYVTARISPGVTIIRHGGWFKAAAPNVDIGGCPNSLMGEGEYTNGVVNDPTISPVTPGKATTLVQVQDAEYL